MVQFSNSFVGRKRELAELRAAIDDLGAGRARFFMVSGEPGIGKTRLAEEVAAAASVNEARVVWGRCWEGGGAPAYWPWMQIFRGLLLDPSQARLSLPAEIAQLVPEASFENSLRRNTDPLDARFRLFDAAAATLRELSRRKPIVVIVDDLHDADQSSLEMLRFVARTLLDANMLVVATYRDAEVQRSPVLASTVAELGREAPQLLLAGLSAAEVAGFVQDRSGMTLEPAAVATIAQLTAGNPLFLEGVVRTLMAEGKFEPSQALQLGDLKLPDSQRMAIAARLGRLSIPAQAMLPYASALGNEFEIVQLETVSNISNQPLLDLLDEIVGAGLMRVLGPHRYRFAHALIRGSIYDEIGSAGRIALHRHIAEKLEELYHSNLNSHLAELAHHFTLSAQHGDTRKAIDYSIRAAEAADRALAYNEAFTLRQTALRLLGDHQSEVRKRAFLLAEMGRVGGLSGRNRIEITAYYEDSIAIYAGLNDHEEEARGRFNLGMQLAKGDDESYIDVPRARAELGKAEDAVAPMGNTPQLGRIRGALALAAWQALDPEAGLQATANAMSAELDEFWWCTVSNFRAIHLLHSGRMHEAFEQFDAGAARARVASDPLARFRSAYHAGNLLVWSWQPVRALGELEAGIVNLMLSRGSLQHQMLSRLSGQAAVMIGDLDRARDFLRDGALPLLEGQLAFYEGEWDRAQDVLIGAANRMREAGARAPLSHYLFWLARVVLAAGNVHRAESLLREGVEIASSAHASLFEMLFRPELVTTYVQLDRPGEAKRNLERCQEITGAGENWYGLTGHFARAQGVFAASQGDWTSAARSLEQAIDIFREYRMPWEEALAYEAWSMEAGRQGNRDTASQQIDAALTIYRHHSAGKAWTNRGNEIRARVLAGTANSVRANPAPSVVACNFKHEGAIWTISHRDRSFRIRDMKGLRYIAHLLAHPGEEFHVLDLLREIDGLADATTSERYTGLRVTADLGDAGAMLDQRSKAEYRNRRDELGVELEEAEAGNDRGAVQRIRAELEMIDEQLAAAMGLGGRDRKAADHSERARDRIRKSIHKSLASIRENDPSLGHHLTTCIRTGYLCAYHPDPAAH